MLLCDGLKLGDVSYQVYCCATACYSCWDLALLGAGEMIRGSQRRIFFVAAQDDMASCFFLLVPVWLGVGAAAMMRLTDHVARSIPNTMVSGGTSLLQFESP